LIGRKIAGDGGFAYTPALSAKAGTWTPESLTVFLQDPAQAVPGTAMPVQVPDAKDGADIAAYFATVK
jgi:cytochrome c